MEGDGKTPASAGAQQPLPAATPQGAKQGGGDLTKALHEAREKLSGER